MKQFFANIRALSLPAPAAVWAAMEQGAEIIHELPYRFARWLPSVPGLLQRSGRVAWDRFCRTETVQEVLDIYRWLEHRAEDIHELPYRFVHRLPSVPERWNRRCRSISTWLEKKDITPRVKLMAPLCLSAAILPFCLQPIENTEVIYLLTEGGEPEIIRGTPDTNRRLSGLSIFADESGRDAQLVLDEGQTITVQAGGETLQATTRHETIGNLLRRLDVSYGGENMVVVDISGKTPTIRVQAEYTCDWQASLPTDYTTTRVPNYLETYGKETILQAGQQGTIITTYRDVYREGQLATTLLVGQEIIDPVQEVVEYGTLVQEVSRSDRIQKVVYNTDGSGYLLFKSGKTMTFSEKVTCNATAYSIGNWTASGLPTKVGHIAVDPKVFPYGTRFYIFTNDGYLVYGNAVAADCGSAIKGYKIDLWFETFDEACWFGRRDCTVFVLD